MTMITTDPAYLESCRRRLGASMGVWARLAHRIDETCWVALSGAPTVDFNLALCWGRDGQETIKRMIDELRVARVPGQVMVCGHALGHVQALVDAGWVCVAGLPFMRLELHEETGPAVDCRQIGAEQIEAARGLLERGAGLPPGMGRVAMPDELLEGDDRFALGLYENDAMVGATALCCEGSTAVGWSFVIAPEMRRRGFGRKLARGTREFCRRRGASEMLCTATNAAEHLYLTDGFETLEHWQVWSRRRWVLAGA
jgi:GNAT superfamily N-acetyltransferase